MLLYFIVLILYYCYCMCCHCVFQLYCIALFAEQTLSIVMQMWSHFILGGLNYYTCIKKLIQCTLLLLLRWHAGKVRNRFGVMGRF